MNTEELLKERGKVHGDFSDHARVAQNLKGMMVNSRNWAQLSSVEKEALEMIQHKIARVLSGDPTHRDHWDDIAGYAMLVSQRLDRAT